MGTVTPTISQVDQPGFGRAGWLVTWTGLKQGDSGAPADLHAFADRSFQVEGVFGAAGAVVCEGSNDGVNFRALNDHFGAVASLSAAGIVGINQNVAAMRPRVTGGDGNTLITVTMYLRRTQQ